uniref:Glycosyltransferase 2-like domain-containing protein n=1 Tax=viral metagenome TaxID=1070528 RepID=A0A6C0DJ31_9ZZZZ
MFSLCIPTIDRFENFLSRYLPKYLANEYIDEIIITDENGNDIEKIKTCFPEDNKLILVKNESRLGPFLNKIKACSLAKNEWIVLMDSDNFAYKDYFIKAKNYIEKNINNEKNIILAPSFARPNFNYYHLSGSILKKGCFNDTIKSQSLILMNTGNYVINKYLIDNLELSNETENIPKSSACDVIYFNTLLFEQLDLNMHIVEGLEYDHIVHDGSVYLQTCSIYSDFNNLVYSRYNNLM